jgi:hypothetical protein
MLQAILVDSRPDSLERICRLAEKHFPQLHIIACCRTADKAAVLIHKFHPALVIVHSALNRAAAFRREPAGDAPFRKILIGKKPETETSDGFPVTLIDEPVTRRKLSKALAEAGAETAGKRRHLLIRHFNAIRGIRIR